MIHGFFLIIYKWQMKPRKEFFKKLGITNKNTVVIIFETLFTLFIVVVAWIFFRAENTEHAINYISGILSPSLFTIPTLTPKYILFIVCTFFFVEWIGRENKYAIAQLAVKWKRPYRLALYYFLILTILFFGGKEQQFIYFQF